MGKKSLNIPQNGYVFGTLASLKMGLFQNPRHTHPGVYQSSQPPGYWYNGGGGGGGGGIDVGCQSDFIFRTGVVVDTLKP